MLFFYFFIFIIFLRPFSLFFISFYLFYPHILLLFSSAHRYFHLFIFLYCYIASFYLLSTIFAFFLINSPFFSPEHRHLNILSTPYQIKKACTNRVRADFEFSHMLFIHDLHFRQNSPIFSHFRLYLQLVPFPIIPVLSVLLIDIPNFILYPSYHPPYTYPTCYFF